MLTQPRYEFKYIVTSQEAIEFIDRLEGNMIVDPNAKDGGYHVNSIYLDTLELSCYYEKIDGEKRRFKFRVRWYGELYKESDLESTNLYVEVKNRNNDMNFKNRVKLPGKHLIDISDNGEPLKNLMELASEKDQFDANLTQNIARRNKWFPMCITSYFRQPFLWPYDRNVRITIDSNLRTLGPHNILQTSKENGIQVLPLNLCVLEIKFNWAMPLWLLEICTESGLDLRRYSKYAACMERLYPQYTVRSPRFQEAL